MTSRKSLEPPRDHLTIEVGQWFRASASGRLSIATVMMICGAGLIAKAAGWW